MVTVLHYIIAFELRPNICCFLSCCILLSWNSYHDRKYVNKGYTFTKHVINPRFVTKLILLKDGWIWIISLNILNLVLELLILCCFIIIWSVPHEDKGWHAWLELWSYWWNYVGLYSTSSIYLFALGNSTSHYKQVHSTKWVRKWTTLCRRKVSWLLKKFCINCQKFFFKYQIIQPLIWH